MLAFIYGHPNFALKGGTAINFFIRNLPRLSVDIDLTWLPLSDRATTIKTMDHELRELAQRVLNRLPGSSVQPRQGKAEDKWIGLLVAREGVMIKVEPNLIIRGTVYPPEHRTLSKDASQHFERSIEVKTLSFADLYGSKICAALDRQHPRDLFDIKLLLENEGLSTEVRTAFIMYLISHNRPMIELLNPNLLDINALYKSEFAGMPRRDIPLEELIDARAQILRLIRAELTNNERRFILSVKAGEPNWTLLPLLGVEDLPAVQWKLSNIKKMNRDKHEAAFNNLKSFLDL